MAKVKRKSKDDMACNKPTKTPSHGTKSHMVKACSGGKEKIIRFGQQGVSGAGSAQMQFQVRSRGGAWQTKRFQGVTSSFSFDERLDGGIVIDEQSDVRWRVQSVSDNNTQATGLFEYFLIDK